MNQEKLKHIAAVEEQAAADSSIQHEDAALKTAFLYFAKELLPYFGITKKVVGAAATDMMKLELEKYHEDFNFIMEDGSWTHFEFQSQNGGRRDLKRFRAYEAVTSYQHKVAVTTYVLFSGNIKKPMTEYTEGVNTYRIIPITMKSRNADQLIAGLREKQEREEELRREDLALLTLCLLMDGEMSLKDRVRAAYQITREAEAVDREVIDKIETILYVMADKFLDALEMEELMEVVGMTRLGQKLVNKGREEGRQEGREEGREEERLELAEGLIGFLEVEVIADRTKLPLETVLKLKESKQSAPAL